MVSPLKFVVYMSSELFGITAIEGTLRWISLKMPSNERVHPDILRTPDLSITIQSIVSLGKNSYIHLLLPAFSKSIST